MSFQDAPCPAVCKIVPEKKALSNPKCQIVLGATGGVEREVGMPYLWYLQLGIQAAKPENIQKRNSVSTEYAYTFFLSLVP